MPSAIPGVVNCSSDPSLAGDLCYAEIQDFGVAPAGDKNICRLDVAVDDALRVGSVQSISDLDGQIEHRLNFQGLAANSAPKRLALQQLHSKENSPLGLVDLVNGADVGMIQCRSSLGFTLKSADHKGALCDVIGQELESYKATELYILGFVYDTHRAGAEFFDDVIVRDGLSNHRRECYFRETGKVNEARGYSASTFVGMISPLPKQPESAQDCECSRLFSTAMWRIQPPTRPSSARAAFSASSLS